MAPSSTALIIGRAIAGIGISGLSNGCFLLIAYFGTTPAAASLDWNDGRYVWSCCHHWTSSPRWFHQWREVDLEVCFYINLPLGSVCALVVVFFMGSFSGGKTGKVDLKKQVKQMDAQGTLVLLTEIICPLFACSGVGPSTLGTADVSLRSWYSLSSCCPC